jgi:hypothetical protein
MSQRDKNFLSYMEVQSNPDVALPVLSAHESGHANGQHKKISTIL